ncbi:MAG TPA: hypothetical protein VG710_17025, partial [Opitutus sp.]|nr:hypothetical protein [Opitutus sp.]
MSTESKYRVLQDRKLMGQMVIATWGFLLTGLIGTGLTYLFNRLDWQARTRFEESKLVTANRRDEIKSIINLCQRRFFYSSRLYQLLEVRQADEIEPAYKDYKQVIDEWNLNLHVNRLLIQKIINDRAAELFCDSIILNGGGASGDSVHTKFFLASNELRKDFTAWQAGKPFDPASKSLVALRDAGKSLQRL